MLPADKYKLYKKLSKPAPHPPSTPPRDRASSSRVPHLLPLNARTIETTAPLTTFNPFSPQKNKGKQKDVPISNPQSNPNPFGSPVKAKSTAEARSSQLNVAPQVPKPSTYLLVPESPPVSTNAISRARKRLRGEPVSPSPNKDKRRRVTSQSTLSFPALLPELSNSDDDDDELNLSFVSDSPMKAPAGSKSFKLLFEDTKTQPRHITDGLLAPTMSLSQGLFGGKSRSVHNDEDLGWGIDKSNGKKLKGTITMSEKRSMKRTNHLTDQTQKSTKHTAPTIPRSEKRTSTKRPQPDSETECELGDVSNQPSVNGLSLLPPSPPGPDSATYQSKQGNKMSKANATRKKPKIANDQDESDDNEDYESSDHKTNVKIVNRTHPQFKHDSNADGEDDFDFDSDPILSRAVPHGHVSHHDTDSDACQEAGQFKIDLPDKLREVLALESSKTRDSRTESTVKSLLYGRRIANYDPAKGGEIWDVGEDDARHDDEDDPRRDTEGEDDWEGEPIPWEVGEL